jgi:hypothetical protein
MDMELKPGYLEKSKEFIKKVYGLEYNPKDWEYIPHFHYMEIAHNTDASLSFVIDFERISSELGWQNILEDNAKEYKEELIAEYAQVNNTRDSLIEKLSKVGVAP